MKREGIDYIAANNFQLVQLTPLKHCLDRSRNAWKTAINPWIAGGRTMIPVHEQKFLHNLLHFQKNNT